MQTKNSKKIVLTGGHAATTALATIASLKKSKVNWDISWIGSKRAVEGRDSITLEFREFPKLGIKCYSIITGRIQRKFTRYSILSVIKIPFGFLHAIYLLLKIRPHVILSFGGFAAFPVVVAGWIMRIPIVIHEQTIAIGLANKYSAPLATRIALSREESAKFFPEEKIVLTGNPVRSDFFNIKAKKKISSPPVILATGGSRGSQNFNNFIFANLPLILKDFKLIHQTGDLDYEKFYKEKETLNTQQQERYEVLNSIPVQKMPEYFSRADIIIGRAGANTVAEVIASGKPSIFMPIPWSQHNEQMKNAKLAEKIGLSIILDQNTTTNDKFIKTLHEVKNSWAKMSKVKKGRIYSLDKEASDRLALLCEELLR